MENKDIDENETSNNRKVDNQPIDIKVLFLLVLPFFIAYWAYIFISDDGTYKKSREYLPKFFYEREFRPYYSGEERLNKIDEIRKTLVTLKKEKEYKAFASAIKSNYSYAYGFSYGEKTKEEAEKIALMKCKESKKNKRISRSCKIHTSHSKLMYKLKDIF